MHVMAWVLHHLALYCNDTCLHESYFAYLFGVREPSFYGAIDISTGKSILFAPRLPAEYAVWMVEIKALSHFKETYMVDMAYYTDEITKVLNNQYKGSGKPMLFLPHGLNTDSKNFSKPAEFEGIEKFETDLKILHPILTECCVVKSKLELAVIQYANDISSEEDESPFEFRALEVFLEAISSFHAARTIELN
ncbi:metallopeptidase M24 family protein [Artemisia annua]|uniref:Metallopeptidase M24 family protein n=1 Tax=Artemisia annua TaxID=35608 RepID=A0A2U1LKH5_ARTAN|nr:metallopeptidase M24 family protein [Artemisia annua]